MGLVFEDLIRRFNESANETAGDHFTPREVIRLMVNLLLEPDTTIRRAQTSIFAALNAFNSMKFRRGSTSSPISIVNT